MSAHSEEHVADPKGSEFQTRFNEFAQKFLDDLEEERQRLGTDFPLCALLMDEATERVYSTGRIPGKEFYADVYKQKPIKITQKVFVPVKQYPKFNFTGKILGPKGNSLRRLQEETQCKIAIKGRNSVRDRIKEEEMRNSNEPRYAHLNKDLFLEISTVATPAEGYARVAYALAEIRKFLVPDKNDEVSHEQLRELMEIDPKSAKHFSGTMPQQNRSVFDRKIGPSSSGPKYLNLIKRASYPQEIEESVFDRKIGPSSSGPKYMNLMKRASYPQEIDESEEPEEEEVYEYETRIQKSRPIPSGYEYIKARPVPSATTTYKRPQAPVYATEIKRIREAPVKSYKPNNYTILNKHK